MSDNKFLVLSNLKRFYENLRNEIPSNPNLIMNPDFKINQRGKTEYTASWGSPVVGPDRWCLTNGKIQVSDNGIIGVSADTQLRQSFEKSYIERFFGQTVTMSLIMSDNTVSTRTVTLPNSWPTGIYQTADASTSDGTHIFLYSNGTGTPIQLVLAPSINATTKAVKLELGAIATPFVPPDPVTELTRCKRYYQIYAAFIPCVQYNDYHCFFVSGLLPVEMSAIPTVHLPNFSTDDPVVITKTVEGTARGWSNGVFTRANTTQVFQINLVNNISASYYSVDNIYNGLLYPVALEAEVPIYG